MKRIYKRLTRARRKYLRLRKAALFPSNALFLPDSINLMFKNTVDFLYQFTASSITWKQDVVNTFVSGFTEWSINGTAPNVVKTFPSGLNVFQKLYKKYEIYYAEVTMHISNFGSRELTLVGFPTMDGYDSLTPRVFGFASGEIDVRSLPLTKTVLCPAAFCGNNNATLTIRVPIRRTLGFQYIPSNQWWGNFSPLDTPTANVYVNWLVYQSGNYNDELTGNQMHFRWRETIKYRTRLFSKKDVTIDNIVTV